MLLPSALPCDMRRASRFTPSRLFSTPPPSDDDRGVRPPGNGLLGTCRALQSLLTTPAPSSRRAKPARLQSPLTFQPAPPSPASSRKSNSNSDTKLRFRSHSHTLSYKPLSPRSRGPNKRRRDIFEEDLDMEFDGSSSAVCAVDALNPSTPKRARHLPYELPLGLSQTDFYSLHSPPVSQSPPSPALRRQQEQSSSLLPSFNPDAALPSIEEQQKHPESDEVASTDDNDWTTDDDQRLVELVLAKFQLSQRDWDECARRMGKDHASVGQRWQVLVGEGNVGLRRGGRRVRKAIHNDWM
ncbi:uncharacterized protein DSM5745_06981 [Aspergillus mulundensis]|uniref:Myb-like domain-containing protein n=1 Tax=Aspergillus mulundensis TaxID=1810919 RepID=A0A3D8RJV1_9EURO|nr:Uncharacterized protein DSM5745_06981 [Aspergillus mulundensis]RDW74319.1 Uncharacterized protein DSM5745_06981 [Aspergillus mulundensis]